MVDLLELLDKQYPKKASLELVGNRYNLNRDERLILYRGVFDTESMERRKKKRFDFVRGMGPDSFNIERVIIDGYNVLISIESYLKGKIIFRALDGYVRDTSGVHGNHAIDDCTQRSVVLIADFVKDLTAEVRSQPDVRVFLDSPVSKSGELARSITDLFKQRGVEAEVKALKNPDSVIEVMSKESAHSLTATSDTVIIDKVEQVVDIPDFVTKNVFGASVLDLHTLLL